MACEVKVERYLFNPIRQATEEMDRLLQDVPFMHSYIHDLESVCWLAVFTILRHTTDGVIELPYDPEQHFSKLQMLCTRQTAFSDSMQDV